MSAPLLDELPRPAALPESRDEPAARAYPDVAWAVAFTLAGLALAALMAVLSDGVHQDDDLTHVLMARWAWVYPAYLLDNWGRPGFTALYAPAAGLGWTAARLFSGVLTAGTAWLAYRIAVRQGVRMAAAVPALLWLQPLTFTLSYTTLTETPVAFYLALATWLYLRRNYAWSATVISLTVVTRYEAALFVAWWLAALLYRRRPAREWIWVFWAPVLHNVLSYVFLREVPLLMFLDANSSQEYGNGTWLSMFTRWPVAAGVGPLLLAWAGMTTALQRPGGWMWAGSGLAYFAVHAVLYRFGLFATGGYFRFLVPIAPMVAVAAAEGLGDCWNAGRAASVRLRRPLWVFLGGVLLLWLAAEMELWKYRPELAQFQLEWTAPVLRGVMCMFAGVAALALALSFGRRQGLWSSGIGVFLLVVSILTVVQPALCAAVPPPFRLCGPLVLTDRERSCRDAINWLTVAGLQRRPLLAASPWFDAFTGRVPPPRGPLAGSLVPAMKAGDLLVWDAREFASPRHGVALDDLRGRDDFVELWHSGGGPYDRVYCAIFEKRAPRATQPADGP